MSVRVLVGDCREVLRMLPDESVHCVVTSPPYWGLRDYGNGSGGIGLEPTLAEHVTALKDVFREVRRVLRADGTLWLNYGDAYAGSWGGQGRGDKRSEMEIGGRIASEGRKSLSESQIIAHPKRKQTGSLSRLDGLKAKDLMGLPWRIAFALQDDGWWLRSDIIWAKPNPMPESVTDRPTRAHEYVFLMTKSARYWYDAEAIKERAVYFGLANQDESGFKDPRSFAGKHKGGYRSGGPKGNANGFRGGSYVGGEPGPRTTTGNAPNETGMRNCRSVWEIATSPFSEAHFATFPPELAERCIKAGCPPHGVVLDPFGGAGTVGMVADRLQRSATLIELNPVYAEMSRCRVLKDAPLLAEVKA